MGRDKINILLVMAGMLVLSGMAFAGTIEGRVSDEQGEPLPAVIRLTNTNEGTQAGYDGRFSISSSRITAGTYSLEVSLIGYRTRTAAATASSPVMITLQAEPIRGQEVEVTAPVIRIKAQVSGDKFGRIYGTSNLPEVTHPGQEISVNPQDSIAFDASKTTFNGRNMDSRYFTWYIGASRADYGAVSSSTYEDVLEFLRTARMQARETGKKSVTAQMQEGDKIVLLDVQDPESSKHYFEEIYVYSTATNPRASEGKPPVQRQQAPEYRRHAVLKNMACMQTIEPRICDPSGKSCMANPLYKNPLIVSRVVMNSGVPAGTGMPISASIEMRNECVEGQPTKMMIPLCDGSGGVYEVVDCHEGTRCVEAIDGATCVKSAVAVRCHCNGKNCILPEAVELDDGTIAGCRNDQTCRMAGGVALCQQINNQDVVALYDSIRFGNVQTKEDVAFRLKDLVFNRHFVNSAELPSMNAFIPNIVPLFETDDRDTIENAEYILAKYLDNMNAERLGSLNPDATIDAFESIYEKERESYSRDPRHSEIRNLNKINYLYRKKTQESGFSQQTFYMVFSIMTVIADNKDYMFSNINAWINLNNMISEATPEQLNSLPEEALRRFNRAANNGIHDKYAGPNARASLIAFRNKLDPRLLEKIEKPEISTAASVTADFLDFMGQQSKAQNVRNRGFIGAATYFLGIDSLIEYFNSDGSDESRCEKEGKVKLAYYCKGGSEGEVSVFNLNDNDLQASYVPRDVVNGGYFFSNNRFVAAVGLPIYGPDYIKHLPGANPQYSPEISDRDPTKGSFFFHNYSQDPVTETFAGNKLGITFDLASSGLNRDDVLFQLKVIKPKDEPFIIAEETIDERLSDDERRRNLEIYNSQQSRMRNTNVVILTSDNELLFVKGEGKHFMYTLKVLSEGGIIFLADGGVNEDSYTSEAGMVDRELGWRSSADGSVSSTGALVYRWKA